MAMDSTPMPTKQIRPIRRVFADLSSRWRMEVMIRSALNSTISTWVKGIDWEISIAPRAYSPKDVTMSARHTAAYRQ